MSAQESVMSMRCQIVEKTAGKQDMRMNRANITVWEDGGVVLDDRETGVRYLHPAEISINSVQPPTLRVLMDYDLMHIVNWMADANAIGHGLLDQGYQATLLDLDEDGVYRSWSHPNAYIKRVHTKSTTDVIDRIEYFDNDDKLIAEIVHQEWEQVDGRHLPVKTLLKYSYNGAEHVRIISFKGIDTLSSEG